MIHSRELYELTRVRLLTFLREPEAIFWVFVFPLVLATVLGFAFRSAGPAPSRVGILDVAGAEELERTCERDELLETERFSDLELARKQLRKGAIDVLVTPGEPPVLAFDPQRNEAATAGVRVRRVLELEASGGEEAELVLAPVEETGSRYLDFLFPGLLGMNLMGAGMWGIGFTIAEMRRGKLLRRMLVTPMRRSSFFLSFILSRLLFLVLEVCVLCLIGVYVLGVPFRAGILGFMTFAVVGSFAFAGLGLLAAARAKTIEGVSGIINFIMMPMWLGSGVFFSYERFPEALHPFLRLLPLTGMNDALRGMMLDGDSLVHWLPELLVLGGWTAVTFFVSLRIFRWQ